MDKLVKNFDRVINFTLMALAMLFVSIQTLELIWETYQNLARRFTDYGLEYVENSGRNVAVLFFNVILLLEILGTIKVYDKEEAVKARIILIVCLVAVSRKILTLDLHGSEPLAELALSALIFAVAVGYFLIGRSERKTNG